MELKLFSSFPDNIDITKMLRNRRNKDWEDFEHETLSDLIDDGSESDENLRHLNKEYFSSIFDNNDDFEIEKKKI